MRNLMNRIEDEFPNFPNLDDEILEDSDYNRLHARYREIAQEVIDFQQERIDEMMRRENIHVPNQYMREVEEARRLEEERRRNNRLNLDENNRIAGKRPYLKKGKPKRSKKGKPKRSKNKTRGK